MNMGHTGAKNYAKHNISLPKTVVLISCSVIFNNRGTA